MLQAGNPDIFLTIIHRTKGIFLCWTHTRKPREADQAKEPRRRVGWERQKAPGAQRARGAGRHAPQDNQLQRTAPREIPPASKRQGKCPKVCRPVSLQPAAPLFYAGCHGIASQLFGH